MKSLKFVILITLGLQAGCIYSQQNSENMSNQEIVNTFMNGFNDPAQIQTSLSLLAEDYHFKNPMVQLRSKAEFLQLAQEISQVLTGVHIIQSTEDGDWVAVLYEFYSNIPGLETNTATEWFRVEDGMIQESHMIYDASEWRRFYEQMQKDPSN